MQRSLHVVASAAALALVCSMEDYGGLRAADRQSLMIRQAEPRLRVGSESPLAVNRIWAFAVAEDGVTLLRQSLTDEGPWRPLPPIPGLTRVTGLAATDESLFVADGPQHRILSVSLATNEARPFANLPPSFEPADLAFIGSLFFTDSRRSGVFQWSGTEPRSVSPEVLGQSSSPGHIASTGNLLLLSSPDDGTVWQASADPSRGGSWSAVQQPSRGTPGPALPMTLDIVVSGGVSFPLRPTAVASRSGVIYVIDANSHGVFAYSRYWPRPVRLRFGPRPVATPARIAATATQLLILDGSRGVVERWPRLVPTRVSCSLNAPNLEAGAAPPCAQSQYAALARFFVYLNGEQYLPTKRLPESPDIADSFRREYVTATMRTAVTRIACALEKSACVPAGDGFQPAAATAGISVPDVYGESYVDVAQVRLTGGVTLGKLADLAVPSPQFSTYVGEARLADLNASLKVASRTKYRDLAEGPASVPVELVRFVVGIPEESLRTVSSRFPDLTFVPLGEASASRAAGVTVQLTDIDRLKEANKQLQSTIGGPFEVAPSNFPYIGVAEHDIDLTNLDLADAFSGAMGPVRSAATPAPAAPAGVTIRDFRDDDHGTAVSSIIAARPVGFEGPALGAGSLLLAVSDAEPTIGESIRQAYVNQRSRIFNLSFHFGKSNVPPSLKEAVEQYTQALFVVAAGNDTITGPDGNVCTAFEAFPVCWGDRSNVLVVTATTLDGRNLLAPDTTVTPPIPGANWNPNIVHIAAPGEGFYASGRGNTYVRVRGSSFAAPLVTATAALLFAQNVRTPWEIKQRILATADQVAGLDGRVAYGLLNARRAATNLSFALIVDELKRESAIALDLAGRQMSFSTPTEDFTVMLSNIRRLTRSGTGKYDLIYADGERLRRVHVRQTAWPFSYFELDAQKRRRPGVKQGDLSNFVDYIGPIL